MEQKSVKKGEQRNFFEVKAPLTSSKILVYGPSLEYFNGKRAHLDLTRSMRGKNLDFEIKIKVDGEGLIGEPNSLILASSYIRRMMRKGVDYVEDSFNVNCKDGLLIVKPFLITRKKVSREVRKELRNSAKDFLTGYITMRNVYELFSDVMANKIQKELSLKLKKIYPLALCEIRWLEVVEEKKEIK